MDIKVGTHGGHLQHVYTENGEVLPSLGNLNANGKKLVKMTSGVWGESAESVGSADQPVYIDNGEVKEARKPVHNVTITPQGNGTVTIASFNIDGVTGYIKSGSGGGGGSVINTLDVPLLTPMFFDYEYHVSGDDICWIPAIHANEAAAASHNDSGYKSMYFGRHQCTRTSDTTPSASKTYYILDSTLTTGGDYRQCIASDFNADGSFKSGVNYYEFNYRGYRTIYDHLVKEASTGTAKSKTYACSSGNVTINYKQAADGHNIIVCTNDTEVNSAVTNLTTLYNDTEIGTAWYYVLDTGRKRFRLPRTRYSLHGDRTYAKTAQEGNASLKLYFHTGNRDEEEQSGSQLDDLFDMMYPVGSIYISVTAELPSWFKSNGRVWERIGNGKCLWGAKSDNSDLDKEIEAGLPKPSVSARVTANSGKINILNENEGILTSVGSPTSSTIYATTSVSSDTIYGKSSTVQPPAIGVIFWKRTS